MTPIRIRHLALAFVLLALLAAGPVLAQSSGAQAVDGWDAAKWRFGPFAVTPKFELKNLGWDNNVFAETEDPKSDFTATAGAPIDWWLRLGRARLRGVDYFEGVWFATYDSQSGFNQRHDLTLLVPLNRIRPYIGGSYLSTNDRPGYEINARVRHTEGNLNGGAVVRLSSRLELDVSGHQTSYEYDDKDYPGQPYSTELNRRTQRYGTLISYKVTALTTLTLVTESVSEHFAKSPDRNNDGFRILPGVVFDERALIKGKGQVGYRRLNALTAGMPDFSGLVANGELSYTLRGMTRFTVGASRDIHFSYEGAEPFYIQPGVNLSVTQQVTGPWDVQARGSWYKLSYQQAVVPDAPRAPERVDRYSTWGGGIGYRLGRDLRLGLNIDVFRRESVAPGQEYESIRAGIAATYIAR